MRHTKGECRPDGAVGITGVPASEENDGYGSRYGRNAVFRLWPCALMLLCAAVGLSGESEMLFRAQELNLFLDTRLFYDTLAIYPGGTLSWMAAFCTQFFYYPACGIAGLLALWVAVMVLTAVVFRVPLRWSAVLVVAPAALLAAVLQTGYFLYYAKLPGYFFVPTLGYLMALLSVLVHRVLPARYGWRTGWMVLWAVAGYPLFGAWSFLGTLYMAVAECTVRPLPAPVWRRVHVVLAVMLTAAVPQVAYYVYDQTNISHVYTAAMPDFTLVGETFYAYRLPYVLLALCPALAVAAHRMGRIRCSRVMSGGVSAVLVLLALAGVWAVAYSDANFDKELRMARAVENADWQRVLDIAGEDDGVPTRVMAMNKNLALFRLGRAGDEMFRYPDGGVAPKAPFQVKMMQTGAKPLYMHYGKLNFCYRWCMEDCVEFGWNVENLKLMVKTSLLNGELALARKYIGLLKHTMFHRRWAERYGEYAEHPERMSESEEFAPIRHMMTYGNQLDSDRGMVELYLLNSFAKGDGDDPLYQEQTLISALLMRDIGLFWPRFFKYVRLHRGMKRMPVHYQEAAYLYGHLENKVDISNMPFDEEVKAMYERFMQATRRCAGMSEEQMAEMLKPAFGHTFYYYYFLLRNIKTY